MKDELAEMKKLLEQMQAGQTPATAAEATPKGKTKKAPATSAGV